MSGLSCGGHGRGAYYHKLPETRRRRRSGAFTSKRVWVVVKRAVVKAVGYYVGRRRWMERRVMWAAMWAKVRRTVRLPAHVPRIGRRVLTSYDSVSYARNFDDGRWKEEEEDYWRSGSFAYRFGKSGHLGKLGSERSL